MLSTLVLRTQPDDRLVQLAAGGSEAAFEMIVQRYHRELVGYCQRLLLDARAEDAVQQAFLAAWSALRTGTEVGQLRPWLYRIAHNQAISARRRPGWTFVELSEQISGQAISHGDIERRILMRETLAALAALSEPQREAILRTAVEGESYAEAAEAMGLSDTAVRGLVHRARVNLRAAVAGFTPTPLVLWAAGVARRHSSVLAFLSDNPANTAGMGAGAGTAAVAAKSAAIIASSAVVVGAGLATTHTSIVRSSHRLHSAHHHAAPAASRTTAADVSAPGSRRTLRVITGGAAGQAGAMTRGAVIPASLRRENRSRPTNVSNATRQHFVSLTLNPAHPSPSGGAAESTPEPGKASLTRSRRSPSPRHGRLDDGSFGSATPSDTSRDATSPSPGDTDASHPSEAQNVSSPASSGPSASDTTDATDAQPSNSAPTSGTPTAAATSSASTATSAATPASNADRASSSAPGTVDTSAQPDEQNTQTRPDTTQGGAVTAPQTGGPSSPSSPAAGSTAQ